MSELVIGVVFVLVCQALSWCDGVCMCHQDIMKDAVDSGIKSVTQMPYFEGDFWPNVLEDCCKALDGDEVQEKHSDEPTVDGHTEDSLCVTVPCSEPLGKVYYHRSLSCFCCHTQSTFSDC